MNQVELLPAYKWLCPLCGQWRYVDPILAEFGPGEREKAFRQQERLEPHEALPDGWELCQWHQIPERVFCCGVTYSTKDDENPLDPGPKIE
jgi:hypothetical protein